MSDVVLKIVVSENADKKENKAEEIKFSDLGEAQQAEWRRSREFLKQQIDNFVHLLVLDEVQHVGLVIAVLRFRFEATAPPPKK